MWSLVADSLRLRYLIQGKLSPVLCSPFFGGMDVEVMEGEGDWSGREGLVGGLDG